LFRGQTSKEYNNTGIHLLFSRCRKTSSEASLPILLNKAFTDRKNDRFALSNEHLNLQNRTITAVTRVHEYTKKTRVTTSNYRRVQKIQNHSQIQNVDFSSLSVDPLRLRRPVQCARKCQRKVPPQKSGYFTAIGSSSVKMVADICT